MQYDLETREHYDKAANDVAYLKRLDEYALNRVADWAEEIWAGHVDQAVMLMDANPTFPYPDEYRNGRELEYWLDNEYQAQKCAKVRKALLKPEPLANEDESVPPKDKLSLPQIALLHFYQNRPITDNNADERAKHYGWNSGLKLVSLYKKFCNGSNERTSGKLAVINLERVVLELTANPAAQKLAEDELKIARQIKT